MNLLILLLFNCNNYTILYYSFLMTQLNQFTESSFIFVETLKDILINFLDPQIQIFKSKSFQNILLKLTQMKRPQNLLNNDQSIQAILQLNQNILYELKKQIQIQKNTAQQDKSSQQEIQISEQDYKRLQKEVQKAQKQIRIHIGTQHQMKILIDELDEEILILNKKLQNLQKQNRFYSKQNSYLKQKENQLQKQIKTIKAEYALMTKQIKKKASRMSNYQGKNNYQRQRQREGKELSIQNNFLNKKQRNQVRKIKTVTEPSFHQYQNQFMKNEGVATIKNKNNLQVDNKQSSINDNLKYASKMSSKKNSQLKFNQGNINVNLTNLVTIESYNMIDEEEKQKNHFFNRRIKINSLNQGSGPNKKTDNLSKRYGLKDQKKQKSSILNKSVNISPKRQLFIQNTLEMRPAHIQRRKITVNKHKTQTTQKII